MSNFGMFGFPEKKYETNSQSDSNFEDNTLLKLITTSNIYRGDIVVTDGISTVKSTEYNTFIPNATINAPIASRGVPSLSTMYDRQFNAITLNNGDVLILDAVTTIAKFMIYDRTLTTSRFGTYVNVYTASSSSQCTAIPIQLLNGDIVIAYTNSYLNQTLFSIYTSTGTIKLSAKLVENSFNNNLHISSLQTGGFVISYGGTSSTFYPKFAIYDSVGNIVDTIKTISNVTSTTTRVLTLTNGNFVVIQKETTGLIVNFKIFNNVGVSISGIVNVDGGTNIYDMQAINFNENYFLIAYQYTGTYTIKYKMFNNDGTQYGNTVTLPPQTTYTPIVLSTIIQNEIIIGFKTTRYIYDYNGNLLRTMADTVSSNYSYVSILPTSKITEYYMIAYDNLNSTTKQVLTYNINKFYIIGVANNDCIVGDTVELVINTKLSNALITLNYDQGLKPITFDYRSFGGNTGYIQGSQMRLDGIVA